MFYSPSQELQESIDTLPLSPSQGKCFSPKYLNKVGFSRVSPDIAVSTALASDYIDQPLAALFIDGTNNGLFLSQKPDYSRYQEAEMAVSQSMEEVQMNYSFDMFAVPAQTEMDKSNRGFALHPVGSIAAHKSTVPVHDFGFLAQPEISHTAKVNTQKAKTSKAKRSRGSVKLKVENKSIRCLYCNLKLKKVYNMRNHLKSKHAKPSSICRGELYIDDK
ncbi:hypothetical protein HDV01_001845 [Terramyces sp. JEL0728]|nr:hypothetical protein HDV01_001845 [Terramyces sp. JEL0728]